MTLGRSAHGFSGKMEGAACLQAVPVGRYTDRRQMKDYYRILGVERQARPEEIKRAYRRLAKQYHPDVIKDDRAKQDRMYEIQEAYACLENEERRKKYDAEYLDHFQKAMAMGGKTESRTRPTGDGTPDMGCFERFFGFQAGRGMETYQDRRTKKPEGSIRPEEMFAAFFGKGPMREAEKGDAPGSKGKKGQADS